MLRGNRFSEKLQRISRRRRTAVSAKENETMCLALPGKVVAIDGVMATVDVGGVRKAVSLALVDDVALGDYVIVHVGYALNRLDPEEAELTLQHFREIAQATGVPWPAGAP